MKKFSLLVLVLCSFLACKNEKALPELDLLQYGVPMTIKAPEGAVVEKSSIAGIMEDITVKKDDYDLQIFVSQATNVNALEVKNNMLAETKRNRLFQDVVSEEDNGFVYRIKIDSTKSAYDFLYVKIAGDKQYTFQKGFLSTLDEKQVQRMYDSVKSE